MTHVDSRRASIAGLLFLAALAFATVQLQRPLRAQVTFAAPNRVTFRVVADMEQYSEPAGLTQPSPALFYLQAGQSILSVTTQGSLTVLAAAPSGYAVAGPPVTAANARSYTAYRSDQANYPVSLKLTV